MPQIWISEHKMVLPGLEPGSAPYKEAALTFRRQNHGTRPRTRTGTERSLNPWPLPIGLAGLLVIITPSPGTQFAYDRFMNGNQLRWCRIIF